MDASLAIDDCPDHANMGRLIDMVTPQEKYVCYRILDANFNRCVEGLRVVEDFARFRLENRMVAEKCKETRHSVSSALHRSGLQQALLASRDTLNDVGTKIEGQAEYARESFQEILRANFQRIVQSLRTLEEYSKPIDTALAREFESARYQVYTLEKTLSTHIRSHELLANCRLYVLVDGRSNEPEFIRVIESLIEGGANAIQLRDKQVSDRLLLHRAEKIKRMVENTDVLFIVNDRPDVAHIVDADGVHVGQSELPVHAIRQIVGDEKLIGVSTHSLGQAQSAVIDGANYIGVGPVFPSQTKAFDDFIDADVLQQVASRVSLPAFAIGGIDLKNILRVLHTGINRIAVGSAITHSASIRSTVEQLVNTLTNSDPSIVAESNQPPNT